MDSLFYDSIVKPPCSNFRVIAVMFQVSEYLGNLRYFVGSRGHLEDLHSLFEKESFDKFTDGIVQQFMKEEELRAHHQVWFLSLR